MSWLEWAVDDPAPGNCGYSALNVPCELVDPSLRRGVVVHSVEGWFTYVNPSAVMRARGNSWGATIMRSGQVWRHRLRPTFINWHAGGPAQNIGTDGIEMEGKDQPWTPEQWASLVWVLRETWGWFGWTAYTLAAPTDRTQESIRQALLAHGYGSLWEHNWFDYTSCPSGRDDWPWLMPALWEEDPMSPEQLAAIQTKIQESTNHTEAAAQVTRRNTQEQAANIMAYVEAAARVTRASDIESDRREAERVIQAVREQLAALMVSGGGLTFEQVVEASKQGAQQAQREAWG